MCPNFVTLTQVQIESEPVQKSWSKLGETVNSAARRYNAKSGKLLRVHLLARDVVVEICGSRLRLVNFFYARKASDGGVGDTGFRLVRARERPTSSIEAARVTHAGFCSRGYSSAREGTDPRSLESALVL